MIVTNRPRRRERPKPAQPVEITARVVQHVPRRRREPKALEPDPAADARVRAFFLRMGLHLRVLLLKGT
jgi:hypothetical protein